MRRPERVKDVGLIDLEQWHEQAECRDGGAEQNLLEHRNDRPSLIEIISVDAAGQTRNDAEFPMV